MFVRLAVGIIVALLLEFSPSGAKAHTFSDPVLAYLDCDGSSHDNENDKIENCTYAIEQGHLKDSELAWAYFDRGRAYLIRDEYNKALSDFD